MRGKQAIIRRQGEEIANLRTQNVQLVEAGQEVIRANNSAYDNPEGPSGYCRALSTLASLVFPHSDTDETGYVWGT